MVTDALWTDYDNDHKTDLIVVGEFMAVILFKNSGSGFIRITDSGLEGYSGWWNSLAGADFDKDGDTDYIAGNLGNNNYYGVTNNTPLRVYAKDFDSNESIDAILSCYFKSEEGDLREYPVHFWDELNGQSPKFRNQFSSYKQYGAASMDKLLKPYDTAGTLVLKANYTQTSYLENKGNGKFAIKALPQLSQVAPVNGIVITDLNADTYLDVMLTSNDYGNEVFSGRYDAGSGLVLFGNGEGEFRASPYVETGFKVNGDAKALATLKGVSGEELFIATQNLDSLLVFKKVTSDVTRKVFDPQPSDSWASMIYTNAKKEKVEFYFGSGYLSQSTRRLYIPHGVKEIIVYDFKGNHRSIAYDLLATAASLSEKKNQ
jgi:hypothetical protein